MLCLLKKIFISRNYDVKVARTLGITREEAVDLIAAAIILHDIGKTHYDYQDRKKGFPDHEIFSACIAHRLLTNMGYRKKDVETVSLAISLHHHTMVKHGKRARSFRLHPNCKASVEHLISMLSEKRGKSPGATNVEQARFIGTDGDDRHLELEKCRREIKNLLERLRESKKKEGKKDLMREVYIILYPLIIVDNIAANYKRGEMGGQRTSDIIRESYEWLLKNDAVCPDCRI